jgi:hypothetical protein
MMGELCVCAYVCACVMDVVILSRSRFVADGER